MEKFYALDLETLRGAGGAEILRELRAVVGRAKKAGNGSGSLSGVALSKRGEQLRFYFRIAPRSK